MKLFPEILLICLFLFLYKLFIYAKDNFILLRKNVTLEYLFNITFIGFLFCIFSARIVYVLEHVNRQYINPLVFVLFPYFPGLSLAGGICGFLFFLFYATKRKKFPFWDILDIFSLSFLFSYSIGIGLVLLVNFLFIKKISYILLLSGIGIEVFFLLCSFLFSRNTLKEGSFGYLSLSLLVLVQTVAQVVMRGKITTIFFHVVAEDIFLLLVFILCFGLFIHRQMRYKK